MQPPPALNGAVNAPSQQQPIYFAFADESISGASTRPNTFTEPSCALATSPLSSQNDTTTLLDQQTKHKLVETRLNSNLSLSSIGTSSASALSTHFFSNADQLGAHHKNHGPAQQQRYRYQLGHFSPESSQEAITSSFQRDQQQQAGSNDTHCRNRSGSRSPTVQFSRPSISISTTALSSVAAPSSVTTSALSNTQNAILSLPSPTLTSPSNLVPTPPTPPTKFSSSSPSPITFRSTSNPFTHQPHPQIYPSTTQAISTTSSLAYHTQQERAVASILSSSSSTSSYLSRRQSESSSEFEAGTPASSLTCDVVKPYPQCHRQPNNTDFQSTGNVRLGSTPNPISASGVPWATSAPPITPRASPLLLPLTAMRPTPKVFDRAPTTSSSPAEFREPISNRSYNMNTSISTRVEDSRSRPSSPNLQFAESKQRSVSFDLLPIVPPSLSPPVLPILGKPSPNSYTYLPPPPQQQREMLSNLFSNTNPAHTPTIYPVPNPLPNLGSQRDSPPLLKTTCSSSSISRLSDSFTPELLIVDPLDPNMQGRWSRFGLSSPSIVLALSSIPRKNTGMDTIRTELAESKNQVEPENERAVLKREGMFDDRGTIKRSRS